VLTTIERPLSGDERRDLETRLRNAQLESGQALVKTGLASGGVCGVLAIATFVASSAPRVIVLVFWVAAWIAFTLWIGLPWRRLMREQRATLEEALRTNRVREVRLQSAAVIEFEEEEDEGACYAFGEGSDQSVFVVGQEFYEDEDFPNSDFSMIELLGQRGQAVDVLLVKRGAPLRPIRVVPANVKRRYEIPEHLTVVAVPLDRIEDALLPLAASSTP